MVPVLDHSVPSVLEEVLFKLPCGVWVSVPLDAVLIVVPKALLAHNGLDLKACNALTICGDGGI